MWATKMVKNNEDYSLSYSYFELSFNEPICLSKIKIYNYNDINNLDICAREIELFFDNKFYGTIALHQGVGEQIFGSIKNKNSNNINADYSQDITFPIDNIEANKEYIFSQIIKNKFGSFLFNQNYETPYLPCGMILKFKFSNNYTNKNNNTFFDTYFDLFNRYKIIGINKIEIYDEKGINILNNNNCKIISNCEILNEDLNEKNKDKILLNGTQNENGNNYLFFIFELPFLISYIKIFPLTLKDNISYSENTAKDFKIFCDNYIVFEGVLNKNNPTYVFFSSEINLFKNIEKKTITHSNSKRIIKEDKNSKYISLTFK